MEYTLQAEKRTKTGTKSVKVLREGGKVPAVVYGAGGETESISLNEKEFTKVWHEAGESTVISLDGLNDKKTVLIQEVALEPLYDTPLHVDLLAVRADEAVEVAVPLVFVGVAPAEKDLGGTLAKIMYEIQVSALPKDLPQGIDVDIAPLVTFEDQILVENITLPSGVTAITAEKEVVALVQAAKEEEVEEAPEATDLTDIEVEKKGKEEGEGEESSDNKS